MDATVFTINVHTIIRSIIIYVKDGCHHVHNVHTIIGSIIIFVKDGCHRVHNVHTLKVL